MNIVFFQAENYRSLKNFKLDVGKFLVIVGENNSGKSTIFRAMDLFLSSTVKGIDENTYYQGDISRPIVLTATFDSLTEHERQKLQPWMVDEKLIVKKEYRWNSGRVEVRYFSLLRVPDKEWLNDDYEYYNEREIISKLPIYGLLPPSGRITKDIYRQAIHKYIETYKNEVQFVCKEKENPGGYKQVLDGYLPIFYLIPAVRDITEETKTSSNALLGKFIGLISNKVINASPKFEELQQAMTGLKTIIEGATPEQKLQEIKDLERELETALSDWRVRVGIHVESPDLSDILQMGTHITLDDGIETSIEQKGHGLQRSMIFALIRVWADRQALSDDEESKDIEPRPMIFAFEEPELYLHPHVCRATYRALRKLSDVHQMLLCTHSAHFVNLDDYRDIVIIRKAAETGQSVPFRVEGELFESQDETKKRFNMVQFFNPDRSEVFFAKKVILVEGATEKAVLPLLALRLRVYDYKTSIIDCGGKFNLTLYMHVLNAFRIPYITIFDEDPLTDDIKPGGSKFNSDEYENRKKSFSFNSDIKSASNPEISKIIMIPGDFEKALGISKSHAEKVGKPYAAIEKYSNEEITIPNVLETLVRQIYSE